MKKIIYLISFFLATNLVVHAQNAPTIKKHNIDSREYRSQATDTIKKWAEFKRSDPMTRAYLISLTKRSAETKKGPKNVAFTKRSRDGKTITRISKTSGDVTYSNDSTGSTKTEKSTKNGSTTECESQPWKLEVGYSDNNLLSPMQEIMWVGNILDGNTILNGGYSSLSTINQADRNPYPISIDLNAEATRSISGTIGTSGTINRGAYNDMLNSIKNQGITLQQTGESGFSYSEVYNSTQVYAELSASIVSEPARLTASINASSQQTKKMFMVQFYEVWFTATLDIPTWDLVKDISKINDEAMVVSSIKYGRMGTFMFETTTNLDSLKAYLSVAGSVAPGTRASTIASAGFTNVHRNTTIKSFTNGRNGTITSLDEFINFIKEDRWNATSPHQPLAYTMRFVKDGSIANVYTSTEYEKRECKVIPPPGKTRVTVSLDMIKPTRDVEAWGEDLCGNITATLMYKNRSRNVQLSKSTIWSVRCEEGEWMSGIDRDNPLVINKAVSFEVDADKAATAFLRISLDIRDGLEGRGKWGLNEWNLTTDANRRRGYAQYEKRTDDFKLNALQGQEEKIFTLQEVGGSPRIEVKYRISKTDIR